MAFMTALEAMQKCGVPDDIAAESYGSIPSDTDSTTDLADYLGDMPGRGGAMTEEMVSDILERLAWRQAYISRQEAKADASVQAAQDRATAWLEWRTKAAKAEADALTARLEEWALDRRAATDGKWKSASFPAGTVSTKHSPLGSWKTTDESALLAWAKAHRPELVEEVPASQRFMTSAARRATSRLGVVGDEVVDIDTGEAVPGLLVVGTEVTVKVDVGSAS